MGGSRINVLFVCSRNQWRSPTAERIWRDDDRLNVRSRGVSDRAVRTLSSRDIDWADVILVMEWSHRARISERFGRGANSTPVRVLEIADEYQAMDPELVDLLRDRVGQILEEFLLPSDDPH